MSSRKINAWHAAGLIDDATRARLLAYEDEHTRPLALWAVFGIGALAIGLGLISVVAANWEAIPEQLRLAVHLALIALGAGALVLREERISAISPWASEALVFVLAVLGLTFFGHLGQVYQTSSPLWQPIAIWLVLMGPMLLICGSGWPNAALLFGFLVFACWDFATGLDNGLGRSREIWVIPTLVTAAPVLVIAIAGWMRVRTRREDFWIRLEQLAFAYAVGGASLVLIAAGFESFDEPAFAVPAQGLRLVIAMVAALGVFAARREMSARMAASVLAAAGVAMVLAVPASGMTVPAALLFMLFWTSIAVAALQAGWRGVFQLAVAIIALRLIILSFELGGDLLLSGFGLILSGVLILGIAFTAVQVSRQFAPSGESDEGPTP